MLRHPCHYLAQFLFAVCKALKAGMAGLFGPQSSSTSSHVQSICDTLEIPHIETRWDYRMKREDYSVNLYPHPHALGQVRRGFFLIYGSFLFCSQYCQIVFGKYRPWQANLQFSHGHVRYFGNL